MRRLLCILLAFSLVFGVVGCSLDDTATKKAVKEVKKTPKPKEDEEKEDYTYTFHEDDYEKPSYDVTKYVDLKNYKKKKIVIHGVRPEYKKKDIDELLNKKLYDYSTLKNYKNVKSLGNHDAVSGVAFNKTEYKKDSDGSESDYTYENAIFRISQLSNSDVEKLRHCKIGDKVAIKFDGDKIDFTVEKFGDFDQFTVDDLTDDFVKDNLNHDSIKELRKELKEQLTLNSTIVIFGTISGFLQKTCKASVPEDLMLYELNKGMSEIDARVEATMDYDNLLNYFENEEDKSLKEYMNDMGKELEEFLQNNLILEAIALENNVKPDDKYFDLFVDYSLATTKEEYNDADAFVDDYTTEELSYQFGVLFMSLMWCKEHLNIVYE